MATTYTINTTVAEDMGTAWPRSGVLELSVTSDIAKNQSTINWTFKTSNSGTKTVNWDSMEMYYALNANISNKTEMLYWESSSTQAKVNHSPGSTVASGSFTVTHNIDGTYKLRFYLKAFIAATIVNSDDIWENGLISFSNSTGFGYWSDTIDLPVIPRTSTVTCTTVEVGRNPTISITAPSTTFKHTLRYSFGTLSGTIATGLAAGAYTGWSIPTSFLNQIEDKSYGEGTIYCDTYNSAGSLNGTTSTSFRVNVSSQYGPNMDPVIVDSSHESKLLTGDENKIIQYFNTVTYDIGAYTSDGAYIKSYYISCGSQSNTASSGTLRNVESNVFSIAVTDSRGFTTTRTVTKTLVPYIKLTAKLQLVSIDTNGSGSIAISGNMFRGSFGVVDNEPVISYRWKAQDGTWSDWSEVVYNIINDSYYAEVEFQGLDYQETYLFEAKAVDELMTVETEQLVVKCMPVYDWSDTDFQFNVPVVVNGDLQINGSITGGGPGFSAADYIVDQGTVTTGSDNSAANWVYRKWNSGIAECWCRKHVSTAVNSAWGNLYVSGSLSYTNITWGVDFIDIPVANITIAPNASGAFLIAGGSTSLTKDNTGGYEIARGSALTSAGNFYINYYGIGKWK